MTTITENEYKVLSAIATNSFTPVNYGVPECFEETGHVWSDSINDAAEPSGIEGAALSGVCGSLASKGLLESDGESIGMTIAGFEIWKARRETAETAVCDCCGQVGAKLEEVQIRNETDRLCPGCIANEIGSETAR